MPDVEQVLLQWILDNLGREICRPLGYLRGGVGRLLDGPAVSLTDPERAQAETMLILCDDLDRLTRECLGGPGPSGG